MDENRSKNYEKDHILKKGSRYKIPIYLFFILVCIIYIAPMLLVISASLSAEATIVTTSSSNTGFGFWPKDFTLDAYRLAFKNPHSIFMGYLVTAGQAFLGTVLSCIVCGMAAFAIARRDFRYRNIVTFIIFFTMLFSGGMIPTYIVYSKYYHLNDTFWIYILPGISGGAWNTLMVRTFFQQLPSSLFESAKLDGASELTIFSKIALPLSKPVFATVGFMTLIAKWGDWNTSLLYIRNQDLYTLQYLLQKILNEAEFLKQMASTSLNFSLGQQPSETLKYAMCVIAAGPMVVVFPFFQKYLTKGLTIGAVKG